MRKCFLMLLMCSSSLMAQETATDFQAYRKSVLENFSSFRNSVLDDYVQYLQGVWNRYEEFKGVERDRSPKPIAIPKVEALPTSSHSLPNPLAQPNNPPLFTTASPKDLKPDVSVKSFPLSTIDLPFYGMKFKVVPCKAYCLNDIEHADIAETWRKYQADKDTKAVINSLKLLAKEYGLNDWFLLELVKKYSERMKGNLNGRQLLQHYLLVNMGFDIRLASDGSELFLLVPFKQQVYERNYVVMEGKKYYVFKDSLDLSPKKKSNIYTCMLPQNLDKGYSLDLTLKGKGLGIKSDELHKYDVTDGNVRLQGIVDKGTMEAIRHYPQMDIPYYAMSSIVPELHVSLLAQMQSQIQGLSKKNAVSRILHFVQYAFDYATDEEQHGYEKPYFIEENFYYPKNDCEDRAVLFASFVHNLLGLDVHLVHYPGHECTAVNFDGLSMNGDGYSFGGKFFYICDPTYIGASIGQCMPSFRNVRPVVEQWY